jgi:hypothetical protein
LSLHVNVEEFMKSVPYIGLLGLFAAVACGADDSDAGHLPSGSTQNPGVASGSESVDAVLERYLKERAVLNAFYCECDLEDNALDDCLRDAPASDPLRTCLAKAATLGAEAVKVSLACSTQVMRQYNDCMAQASSCDSDSSGCERAYEAQQFRCSALPETARLAWYECKSKFDPNFAGDD